MARLARTHVLLLPAVVLLILLNRACTQPITREQQSEALQTMSQLQEQFTGLGTRKANFTARQEYARLFNVYVKNAEMKANPSFQGAVVTTASVMRKTKGRVYAKANGQFALKERQVDGTLQERPFFFAGTNLHTIGYRYYWDRQQVEVILRKTARTGMKVIRAWCFNDYTPNDYSGGWKGHDPLQNGIGNFDELSFRQWDWLFHRAAVHGLRVICVMSNSWDAYGGKGWWVNETLGTTPQRDPNRFYHQVHTKNNFKAYLRTWASRRNVFSKKLYRNDDAIFSWQLQNEPHAEFYESPPSGDAYNGIGPTRDGVAPGESIRSWGCQMARYLKERLKVKQMIAIGEDGVRTDGRTSVPTFNWVNGGSKGVDFVANLRCDFVSYTQIHYYPESMGIPGWNSSYWLRDFLGDRAEIARVLKKPIIVEEFGVLQFKDTDPYMPEGRVFFFEQMRKTAQFHGYAGFIAWEAWPDNTVNQEDPSASYEDHPLLITYSDEEFKSIRRFVNYANKRNALEAFPNPRPRAPECINRREPGAWDNGACVNPDGGRNCWDWRAGWCRRKCEQCRYWRAWDESPTRTPVISQ